MQRRPEDVGPHTQRVVFGVEDGEEGFDFREGGAVIFDFDGELGSGPGDAQVDMPGGGVLEGVVDKLLDDAEEVDGVFFGEGGFEAGLVEVDGAAARPLHILAEGADAGFERVGGGGYGHEAAGDAAHGFDDFEEVGVHAGDERFGLPGVALGAVEAVEVESEDGEPLDEVVVEFGAHFGDDLFGGLEGAAGDIGVDGRPGFEEWQHSAAGFCQIWYKDPSRGIT